MVEGRVADARRHIRDNDPLPQWSPEQWVAAVAIQLGMAAECLHAGRGSEGPLDFSEGCEHLVAVAAVAMDAVEAMDAR